MLEIVLHFTVKSLRLMKMGREKKCTDREKNEIYPSVVCTTTCDQIHKLCFNALPCNIAENSEASNSQTSIAF